MLCSQLILSKPGDTFEDVKPLPCNRWSCPYCGPKRRAKLKRLAVSGNPNRLLTLTVNPKLGADPTERRAMLHHAWRKLIRRILRHHKWPALHYMAFVERTQKGEPHLHILLRCGFISQKWLSRQMHDLIGAPIVDIRQIHNVAHAARYVAKYVTKAPAQFGTMKRYWQSRDYSEDKGEPYDKPVFDKTTTSIIRVAWADEAQSRISQGYTVETLAEGWFRWWRPGHVWSG